MSEPILYILMRQDLASLTPGKACAQAAHAANLFVEYAREFTNSYIFEAWKEWKYNRAFGTTIVLGYNDENQMKNLCYNARLAGGWTGSVYDPTYPLQDGSFTHLIPLNTCVFIFGDKEKLQPILKELTLY